MSQDIFRQYHQSVEGDKELCSEEVQKLLHITLKHGIYKELHKRSLLSDEQLKVLLDKK